MCACPRDMLHCMMRMLLIWLLVFSTFVGVGCDFVGAPPKWLSQADFATSHFGLSQADFVTSHSWLSKADSATSHSGLSEADFAYYVREQLSGDAWPQAYHLDVNAMRSYSASRVAELAKEAGPTLGLDTTQDTKVRCILRGLLHPERMARDAIKSTDGRRFGASGGRIYTGSSHLNNPVCGAYHSHGPVQSRLHPGPEYADERFRTGPCPTISTGIGRRGLGPLWLGCGEGEKPFPGQKLWVINRRGEFGPPSAVKFGRLRGIRAISRSSSKYVGMGLFLAWGRMKAWLQKQYPDVSANVAGLSSRLRTRLRRRLGFRI